MVSGYCDCKYEDCTHKADKIVISTDVLYYTFETAMRDLALNGIPQHHIFHIPYKSGSLFDGEG